MARCTLLVVAWLLVGVAATADDTTNDQEAIQGEWVVVSFVFNGKSRPADDYKDLRLAIKGDKYLITQGGETASRTLTLDPATKPKAMDVTYDDGPNKGKTNRAIYVLQGNVLTICRHQQPEMERPQEFTSEAGSDRALMKWKRVK
jgi:uncharacterized protein (TIGR03067 family)